jgi:hypothetical protein
VDIKFVKSEKRFIFAAALKGKELPLKVRQNQRSLKSNFIFLKNIVGSKNCCTFAPAKRMSAYYKHEFWSSEIEVI